MDLEGYGIMTLLTTDQQKQLLMLTTSKWNELRKLVKSHYKLGSCMPIEYTFLVALTSEQWQTVVKKLIQLRQSNRKRLQVLRKQARQEATKVKKKDYMRSYMQQYRQRKEQQHGQDSS